MTCDACGSEFVQAIRGRPRRYCRECVPAGSKNGKAWRAVNAERVATYNAARRKPTEERACVGCGTRFTTSRQRRYCNRACGSRYRWRLYYQKLEAERREGHRAYLDELRKQEAAWRRAADKRLARLYPELAPKAAKSPVRTQREKGAEVSDA